MAAWERKRKRKRKVVQAGMAGSMRILCGREWCWMCYDVMCYERQEINLACVTSLLHLETYGGWLVSRS